MSSVFDRTGINKGSGSGVTSSSNYSSINTGGEGEVFPDNKYVSSSVTLGGEEYDLRIVDGVLELVDSDGNVDGTYVLPTVTDGRAGAVEAGPFAFDGVVLGNNGGLEFSIHNSHGQHGNFTATLQERIGTGVVVTTVLDDGNNVITTDAGEEPITAEAVAAMGRELVSDNRVADAYPAESDEFLLTAGGIVEAITQLSGEGAHITTVGEGDNIVGLGTTDGNLTSVQLGTDATARRNIGAQQQIDGVFLASTAAQRALDPPAGELAFYANVDGVPTLEQTQPLLVRGIVGRGDPTYEFNDDNETQLWFEVEFSGSGGGGSNIAAFDTDTPYSSGENFTFNNKLYKINGNVADNTTFDTAADAVAASTQLLDGDIGGGGVANIAAFVAGEPYTDGENFILGNKLYAVNGASAGFANEAAAISNSTLLLDGDTGDGIPTFVNTAAWEAQEHITLDIEFYISTNANYDATTSNTDLAAQGYSDGDEFFIVSRDTTYQVISTAGNLALQFILTNRDSLAVLDGGQSVLDDIANNTAAIEANTQHNHEQDARISALENQDFTTTISSFTESTTLSNLFTSGTIINKGNAGNNLYQAWTVTREGHELIGYLQLTDTERDTFRSEFSLTQGVDSNIYIPANPDAPHTIGIKAFPAADFNDLSSSTQVMLGQISSMRFGGNVGSETMFEMRWELINYSDDIDTGLGTVDSGEIYGAAGDKRYAFLAPTIYTAPAWEFREATVSRTEVITGSAITINTTVVDPAVFVDNNDADGIHWEVDPDTNAISANLNHLPGAAYNQNFTYRAGDEVTFNSTIYLATTTISGNHPPIDGGSSNNVFHGVGAIPNGMAGTGNGQFAWRIAKAGVVVGTFNSTTNVSTDLITAESLHFDEDQFVLTTDLTNGNENIAINPNVLGGSVAVAEDFIQESANIAAFNFTGNVNVSTTTSGSNTIAQVNIYGNPSTIIGSDAAYTDSGALFGDLTYGYTAGLNAPYSISLGGHNQPNETTVYQISGTLNGETITFLVMGGEFTHNGDTNTVSAELFARSVISDYKGTDVTSGTITAPSVQFTLGATGAVTFEEGTPSANHRAVTFDVDPDTNKVTGEVDVSGLGGGGGGSTIRVDSVEVTDPNFIDNAISTDTARGVAFGADALGNIIGQVDVTGLSGMGESGLADNTVGSLVKVNATQDGFDDAVAGTDYQGPLVAGTDYQTPLVAGTDYQVPLTGAIINTLAPQVPEDTWTTAQVNGLDETLTAKEPAFTRSISAPTSPEANDVWYDLNTGTTYTYTGTVWVGDTVRPASQESASIQAPITTATNLSFNNLTLDGSFTSVGGITWRQDETYWVGSVNSLDVVSIANDGHVRTTANYTVVANAAALTP